MSMQAATGSEASAPGQAVADPSNTRSAALIQSDSKSDAQRAEEIAAKFALPEEKPDPLMDEDRGLVVEGEEQQEQPDKQVETPEDPPEAKGKTPLNKLLQASKAAKDGAKKFRQARAQAQEREQENVRLKQELHQQEQFQAALMEDPLGVLKQLKFTDKDITERMVRANTPEEKLAVLEQRLEEERQERLRLESSITQEKQSAQQKKVHDAFWAKMHETAGDEQFVHLSAQPAPIVEWLTRKTFKDIRDAGENPNDYEFEEVAAVMDKWLAANARKKGTGTATVVPGANTGVVKPAPKTLSTATSSRKFTLPANFKDLPDDERMALLNQAASKTLRKR